MFNLVSRFRPVNMLHFVTSLHPINMFNHVSTFRPVNMLHLVTSFYHVSMFNFVSTFRPVNMLHLVTSFYPVNMVHLVSGFYPVSISHPVAGVGDQVDKAELQRIASAAGLSTEFSDFTILSQRLSSQIGALCGQCLFLLGHSLRRMRRCARL